MALDPYSLCPCGSGKKLKFCCSDLASDFEKVQQMVDGEQPHAALKHVEQLLVKRPKHGPVLDLCATLQMALHEFDAAKKTTEAFLVAHPQNASAHAQAALLAAATETGTKAIGPLQNALERLDSDMPLRVLEAIGAVGQALLMEGELVAARGHLLLYAMIAPKQDNRAIELLLRMNLQAGLPLLLREYLLLTDCPDAVSWKTRFEEATKLSTRGLWRRAESLLAALREEVGAVPEVVFNLAVMRGWLAQSESFTAGLHEYAKLDGPRDHAIEAEALAQLVDPSLTDPTFDTVMLAYPVKDIEALVQRLASDQRTESYPMDLQDDDEDPAMRPQSMHMLLDRPTPSTGVDIQRDEVPHVVAFLSLFGKRTDRDARLEVTADRDSRFDEILSLLAEVAGDTTGEMLEESVLAQKSISEDALSWRWRLPNDTPADHRRELLAAERREAILNRWTAAPRAALNEKSPQEAVGEESLRVALQASALILEQAATTPEELSLFAELRKQLELPEPEKIDPTELNLELLPLVRVPRLEISKVADEPLAKLLDRAVLMGANLTAQIVARELVGRPQLAEEVDPSAAYRQLIRLDADHQRSLDWVAKAREWSQRKGQSAAEWALMELEISIQRGDGERVQQVLNEIRENYLDEEGVADATHQILESAGLLAAPAAAREDASDAPSEGLWTPEDSPSDESSDKSVIWTP
ncbi:MAG: SEC-C domain-containing protein [Planctomycetes bacterium]|nr:SEC-C domain-containing protein [Planctomycetota bacterium]